jgi:hypothetical protein
VAHELEGTTQFLLELRGGWALNDAGRLTATDGDGGATDLVPVFELVAASFKLDNPSWQDVAKAMESLFHVLDTLKDDTEKLNQALTELGVAAETMTALADAANVAGKIAACTGVVGAVVAVLSEIVSMAGAGGDGPSKYEAKIETKLNWIDGQIKADAKINQTKDILALTQKFRDGLNFAGELVDQQISLPNGKHEEWIVKLSGALDQAMDAIGQLSHAEQWYTTIDPNEYTHYDAVHAYPKLETLNEHGAWERATWPTEPKALFDHRGFVPAMLFSVQAYLVIMKTLQPEFRSTGDWQDHRIRPLAVTLHELALEMRANLARTRYEPRDFSEVKYEAGHTEPLGDGGAFKSGPWEFGYTVGAFDMRTYTNAVVSTLKQDAWNAAGGPAKNPGEIDASYAGHYATIETHWVPTVMQAGASGPPGYVKPKNPEACAAEANKLADREYAKLLGFSGYLQLLQLIALLRLNGSEPDRSETVNLPDAAPKYAARRSSKRQMTDKEETSVTGPPILFVTPDGISSPATVYGQRFQATIELDTQTVEHRGKKVDYRVLLRTIQPAVTSDRGWAEYDYSSYASTRHQPDGDYLRPETTETEGAKISELVLVDWGARGDERNAAISASGTVHTDTPFRQRGDNEKPVRQWDDKDEPFHASTFEWWVPESTPVDANSEDWQPEPNLEPKPDEGPQWKPQKRKPEERPVSFSYELKWTGPGEKPILTFSMASEPIGRNYVLFLVVEEKLPTSGAVLHTAHRIVVSTALTSVPDKFFADEEAAYAERDKRVRDVAVRFTKVAKVKKGDTVEKLLDELKDFHSLPAEKQDQHQLQTVFTKLKNEQPRVFEQVLKEKQIEFG